jgi:hypothetical protein
MTAEENTLHRDLGKMEAQLEALSAMVATLTQKVEGMQRRYHLILGGFAVISWIFSKVDPIALLTGVAKAAIQ